MAVIQVNSENFEKEVLLSEIPVFVDFWAEWCGPCKMMTPVVESLSEELENKVKVCKLNVSDNSDLADEYGIRSIPTFMVFKDGKVTATSIGVQDKEDLLNLLNQ